MAPQKDVAKLRMAPQKDLAKIGLEGFEMIDEFFGRKRQPKKPYRTPAQKQEAAINCHEMAQAHGGVVITDHFGGKGRGFAMQKEAEKKALPFLLRANY